MNVSRITKGNSIIRTYERVKLGAKVKGTCAACMFSLGAFSAMNRRPFGTIIGGAMSCMYVKELETYLNLAQLLKPEVNKIVKRAKNIYKKK